MLYKLSSVGHKILIIKEDISFIQLNKISYLVHQILYLLYQISIFIY